MKSTPKQPPAPDPYAVAGAQTGSNVSTAVANTFLGNPNINSPLGSSTTKQTGTYKLKDPTTGKTFDIPTFTQTSKLSPGQKTLLGQQEQLGSKMNQLGISQADRLAAHLAQNPNLTEGLPDVREGPQNISMEGLPELAGDMDKYRGDVEQAMFSRLNPQLDRDYNSLENRLINQGLVRGSEAFNTAMQEHGQNVNDARNQVFLASGQEASRLQGEQRANRGQLYNERVTANNDVRANVQSDIARRNGMLQERLTERNQPINEITALMNGGQVSMPQFPGYDGGQVDTTPVGQYVYQSANIDSQNAQNAAESRANMFNSAAKLGAGLFAWSDRRLKTDVRYILTDVNGIDWFMFKYLQDGRGLPSGWHYGVMAQDVAQIKPEAVWQDRDSGFFYVDYGAL